MLLGTAVVQRYLSYPLGTSNYSRRQVEKVIENNTKASHLNRALNRPVSGLFFTQLRSDHAASDKSVLVERILWLI